MASEARLEDRTSSQKLLIQRKASPSLNDSRRYASPSGSDKNLYKPLFPSGGSNKYPRLIRSLSTSKEPIGRRGEAGLKSPPGEIVSGNQSIKPSSSQAPHDDCKSNGTVLLN